MNKNISENQYTLLIQDISDLLEQGRRAAIQKVNTILVETYWNIGKRIVDFEQKGKEKAEYGSELLKRLSKDLKTSYGKGFSKSNIYLMRLFYLKYEKFQTVSGKLTWSHYSELLSVSDDLSRSFYEKQCINENWSVRELKRQINSGLFQRLALSKDKKGVFELAQKGQMNLYLNYFKNEENAEDDNEPIGIILAADKDEILVEYALGSISNQLFVSRYQLYLPDKEQLQQEMRYLLEQMKGE